MELRNSSGSVDNLRRLADETFGIDVALFQGGVTEQGTDYVYTLRGHIDLVRARLSQIKPPQA